MRSEARVALLVLPLLAACEIEKVAIPQTVGRVAAHAVLSATAQTQVVLLERTRSGAVTIIAPPFELEDPFGSNEGVAETGATIALVTPDGRTLVAHEDEGTTAGAAGGGVYRFVLPGDMLVRNAPYRLTIQTTKGEVLTAETSVPGGNAASAPDSVFFDRSRDTDVLDWPAAPGARSYFVRVETPFGPRSFFTESTHVRLTGDLRNVDVASLPHVFIPGFPQAVTVSAVDSNFYDWYRTHNAEVSGTGLVSRMTGGLGVFGSLVRLRYQNLTVVTPQTEPVAGTYKFTGTPEEQISAPYLGFDLYVESKAGRSDQPDALSGRYERQMHLGSIGCPVCGLLGSTRNGQIELVFLRDWFANDTAEVMRGQIRGDTIVGTYRGFGGIARFTRTAAGSR